MAFKVINKLFKGELIQVTPCKGYGYIRPAWNKEALSSKNLYCYYASESEKKRKQCFLKIFEKGGKYFPHEIIKNYRGEEIWIPSNPQIIYFEIEVEGPNYRCVHLFDERHLSAEEKAEAELASAEEPNFNALLKEQMEEASVEETPVAAEVPVAEEKAPVAEVVSVSAPVETTADEEFDYGDESNSDFDEGFKAGEEDGKVGIYRPQEYLFEGEDSLPLDFEEGYEAGYKVGDAERLDALYGESEEKTKKKNKNKATKEEGIPLESLNQREEDKKSSQNKKAQKKAEEAAFEAAFSDSDC